MSNATDRKNIYVIVCIEGFVALLVAFQLRVARRECLIMKRTLLFVRKTFRLLITASHFNLCPSLWWEWLLNSRSLSLSFSFSAKKDGDGKRINGSKSPANKEKNETGGDKRKWRGHAWALLDFIIIFYSLKNINTSCVVWIDYHMKKKIIVYVQFVLIWFHKIWFWMTTSSVIHHTKSHGYSTMFWIWKTQIRTHIKTR